MADQLRELCAELAERLEAGMSADGTFSQSLYVQITGTLAEGVMQAYPSELLALLRGLAQPQGEGPKDDELDELFTEIDQSGESESWRDYARAALARWGNHFPDTKKMVPPSNEEQEKVLARVEFGERKFSSPSDVVLRQYCDDWFYGDSERTEVDPVDLCRGAIKLFTQFTPQPIPASERLPGPGDCDAEGRCWWFEPDDTYEEEGGWSLLCIRGNTVRWTHWLPAHALPVPTTETP